MKTKNLPCFIIRSGLRILIMAFAFGIQFVSAQTPQFFNYSSGGSSNSFPLNSTGSNKVQWIIGPGEFTGAGNGLITKLYILAGSASAGVTYSNFTVAMKQDVITSFVSGPWIAPMTTVFSAPSHTLTSVSGQWFVINLTTPFLYNPAQSLVFEISQTAYTGTGIGVLQTSVAQNRRLYGNVTGGTGTAGAQVVNCGVDISNPFPNDAGISAINAPTTPVAPGTHDIQVTVKNYGTNTLTSADIDWSVNGVPGTTFNWTGALAQNASSAPVIIGQSSFSPGSYTIKAWTKNPNLQPDGNTLNDTSQITAISCIAMAGAYTINSALPTSATNFQTFGDAISALKSCGITGNVTLNVDALSGPYNERIEFTNIPGTGPTSRIIINGNGRTITFNPTAAPYAIITLNGAQYFTFNNLVVQSTNATNGYGFHLWNGSNYNEINSCTIDLNISTTSLNSTGISISGSAINPATAGSNGSFNMIEGCTITGGYYGITLFGIGGGFQCVRNTVRGNVIKDFYNFGVYLSNTDSSNISGNSITRGVRTAVTNFSGINLLNNNFSALIDKNRIHNSNGASTTNTSIVYGVYLAGNAAAGRENLVTNNAMYNFNNNGTHYGIYNTTSDFSKYYHNTISLDNVPSTAGATYGFYQTGNVNSCDFRNNNISVTRGGTGVKYTVFYNSAGSIINSNYNNFYLASAGTGAQYTGYWAGLNYVSLANWQTANFAAFDNKSYNTNPLYVNIATGNLQPQALLLNNTGISLGVLDDIDGNMRDISFPDIGGWEYTITGLDAAIGWDSPLTPVPPGLNTISVRVVNTMTVVIDSMMVGYSDGATNQFETFSGLNLASGASQILNFTTQYNFTGPLNMRAFISQVNGKQDTLRVNDTTAVQNLCLAMNGMFTINSGLPQTGNNFQTFGAAVNALMNCGIGGPVTFNMASGTYNEQISLGAFPGSSSSNTVTFQSASGDSTSVIVAWTPITSSNYTIRFNGSSYVRLNKITVRATGATFATTVRFETNTHNNSITGCILEGATTTSSSINLAVLFKVSGPGNNNLISGNRILNGSQGISYTGNATGIVVQNNTLVNQYSSGMELTNLPSVIVKNNSVTTNSTNTAYAGIFLSNCHQDIRVEKNKVNFNTGTHAIRLSDCNGTDTNRGLVSNNFINIGGSAATGYGLHTSNVLYQNIYYNSVNMTRSGSFGYSIYQAGSTGSSNIRIRNNIFSNPGGGYCIFIEGNPSITVSDNNNFFTTGSSLGFWSINRTSLAAWQSGSGLDMNSFNVNPGFVSSTDLHLVNPFIANKAFPVTEVTDDIDNQARNAINPDIGADEFSNTNNPIAFFTTTPTNLCAGDSVVFNDLSLGNPTTRLWYFPGGSPSTSTLANPKVIYSTQGFFNVSLVVSNINGTDSITKTNNVVVIAPPGQPQPISGNINACQGSATTYSVIPVGGAAFYTWTLPAGWSGSSSTTSISATPGASGGVISVTANNTCGSGTVRTLNVTVTQTLPQPGPITGVNTSCSGVTQVYAISPVAGAMSYTWNLPTGWTGISTSDSITVTTGTTSGNVTVAANNICGPGPVQSFAVTINTPPNQPGIISGPSIVCDGTGGIYSILPVAGALSYTWVLPSGWTGASSTSSIVASAGSTGGIVRVFADNGCGNSIPRDLNVSIINVPAQPGNITGSVNACIGLNQNYSIGAVAGATSYTWTLPSGWTGSSTSASITVTPGATGGTLSVTANNSCGSGNPQTLIVNTITSPAQPGAISGPVSVCPGTIQTFTISAVTGASGYQWMVPAGWVGTSSTTSITVTVGSNSGSLTVAATNACGNSAPQPLSVTVYSGAPVPVISQQGAVLNSSVSTGNQWYLNGVPIGGANSQAYTPVQNGNYTVSVTDSNGCTSISPVFPFNNVGIGTIDESNLIRVYPNPGNGLFMVDLNNIPESLIALTVTNMVGQVIYSQSQVSKLHSLIAFDITQQSAGTYFLSVKLESHVINMRIIRD